MWSILLMCSDPRHGDELLAILSSVERRVRVHRARDRQQALSWLDARAPMLTVISELDSSKQTLDLVAALHRHRPELPIMVEVPADRPLVALQALGAGATDSLRAPVPPWEWVSRARALLDLQRQKRLFAQALQRRYRTLSPGEQSVESEILFSILARADILHDVVTGGHDRRTGLLAQLIAQGLALPAEQCRMIQIGGSLHDIGKIGIADEVLKKPGRYTAKDRNTMRAHPQIGYDILKNGSSPALRMSAEIALSHHEHYDGSGYPKGLSGEDIPLAGRITAVADVFDALAARGTYRSNLPVGEVLAYLSRLQRRHFDPDCVEALRANKEAAGYIVSQI